MKKIVLLITLFLTCSIYAQKYEKVGIDLFKNPTKSTKMFNNCGTVVAGNLVINGGFEEFSTLPTATSQLPRACNWMDDANSDTPDYLHRNSPSSNMSIPNNTWGNQDVNPVFGGDGYAGMWINLNSGNVYTEIIKTELTSTLQPNTQYTLTFDVSMADNFTANPVMFQAFLGGQFATNVTGELPIQNDPNGILLSNTSFSTNSTGWDTITFTFTTGSIAGQQYLYIGGISNIVFQNQGGIGGWGTYYYVDNVNLVVEDTCPDCDLEQSAQIHDDLWQTFREDEEKCGLYTFRIPELEDCFEIVIDWGDGQTDVVSSTDSGTVLAHQYTSDGTFTICTQLLVDGQPCGRQVCKRVVVDCEECPECDPERSNQIQDALWNTFEEDKDKCGLYTFKIPELEECYEIVINWGDGQTDVVSSTDSGTILSHQYTSNAAFTVCTQVFVDGKECGREYCKRIEVDCLDCPECDPDRSAEAQQSLWNTFEEDEKECGLYAFKVPELADCYEIAINWGDGQTDIVTSNDAGSILSHQYTSNGSFTICTQVFVDGKECGDKVCKKYEVNCDDPNPECDWLKSIGTNGGSSEEEIGVSVVVDSNDDVILLGASLPNTNIEGTLIPGTTYISKYDPDGCFISATDISFVGVPVDMEINNNDELLILTKDNIGYNSSNNNYYLNKLDSSGNLIWTVTLSYGQATLNGVDTVKMDLKRATNEVFLLTTVSSTLNISHTGGTTTLQQIPGNFSDLKVSIIKISSNGSIGWSQTVYGLGHVRGVSISASENSNELFFLGSGRSEGAGLSQYYDVIFRNNNTGVENTATMIPNNYGFNVNTTDFIAKITTSNGAFITFTCFPDWRSSPSTSIEYNENTSQLFTLYQRIPALTGRYISIEANNLTPVNQYVYNSNTIYSSIVNGQFLYISGINGGSRFHISKINSSGIVWEKTPSNTFSLSRDVAFNGNKIYTTGYFRNNNINLGNGDQIDYIGGYDGFITRLEDQGSTGIFQKFANDDEIGLNDQKDELAQVGFTMYPNPASNEIQLKFVDKSIKKYEVYVRNVYGRIVLQGKDQKTLQVNSLHRGVYYVEIITEKGRHFVERLMIK